MIPVLKSEKYRAQSPAIINALPQLLRQEGCSGFFSSSSSLADLNNLGHPPGYSILIALVRAIFGSSTRCRFNSRRLLFDSSRCRAALSNRPRIVFAGAGDSCRPIRGALATACLEFSAAVAGFARDISHSARAFSCWREAVKKPRLVTFVMIGALVGLSCWLRANAMLLTVFLAAAVLLLHGKKQWRYSLAVIAGTLLIVLPLTIRNAIATRSLHSGLAGRRANSARRHRGLRHQ